MGNIKIIKAEYDHSDNWVERWDAEKEMNKNFENIDEEIKTFEDFEKDWINTTVDNITAGDGFPAEVLDEWFEYKGHGKFDVYRKVEAEEYLKEKKAIEKWVEECSSAEIRVIKNDT